MLTYYENETDYCKALLDLPMSDDPGATFAYSTPAVVSLGQAIVVNSHAFSQEDDEVIQVFNMVARFVIPAVP